MKEKNYVGIDYFRIIAAILVVTIHTSPLVSINVSLDFLLTRIIARVAVPFFFMVSGFFLFRNSCQDINRLKIFINKITGLYGIAILLYLPLNIYNGYFKSDTMFIDIIKDVVFNGTFYHLWYLPAAAIGSIVAWFLIQKMGLKRAFIISLFIYIIGLFGDSYYGITQASHVFKNLYDIIFNVTDYTRNGIFYAPIFFILGGILAKKAKETKEIKNKAVSTPMIGTVLFTLLMICEGFILRKYHLQRHDSMYILLIPCMYFLFQLLLNQTLLHGKDYNGKVLREISTIIYIIHPWIIVLVRLAAKVLKQENLLIGNSVVHFSLVILGSLLIGCLIVRFRNYGELQRKNTYAENARTKIIPLDDSKKTKMDRAWIEINLNNLKHNARVIKKVMPDNCDLMAVVKTNAYGHGAEEIAAFLNQNGINTFAVATIKEGISLRKNGIQGEILILGHTDINRTTALLKYDLIQTITSYEYGKSLHEYGLADKIKVHIKIDTGMHRLGLESEETDNIIDLFTLSNLEIDGIFTHLCVADSKAEDDIKFTKKQIDQFYALLDKLQKVGIKLPKIHIQSSYGLLNYPELSCDYARIGIALYGTFSTLQDTIGNRWNLRPVLELKAKVALTREIMAGENVSYGRLFTAKKDTKIAVITIGYGDGYPRHISLRGGNVLLHGKRARVIGRICMDQLVVDISAIGEVKAGDIATLIGKDGEEEILAAEVAEQAESITNELLCRLGERLEKIYISDNLMTSE